MSTAPVNSDFFGLRGQYARTCTYSKPAGAKLPPDKLLFFGIDLHVQTVILYQNILRHPGKLHRNKQITDCALYIRCFKNVSKLMV